MILVLPCKALVQRKDAPRDPAYALLESLQEDVIRLGSPRQREIYKNIKNNQELVRKLAEDLEKRDNASKGEATVTAKDANLIQRKLMSLKLPTKYEDPAAYFILFEKITQVEEAIKELKLPLATQPKFGTLPTAEINALKVPVPKSEDNLVILHTQTFSFNHEMTKAILPTIGIELGDGKSYSFNTSAESALQIIRSKPAIRVYFLQNLLDFLMIGVPAQHTFTDQTYDPFLVELVSAMELFQVGHEYGHVIRQHPASGTNKLQLVPDSNGKSSSVVVSVINRSWTNELEADSLGFKIMVQAQKKNPNSLRVYAMTGAIFFLACMDILERAEYVLEHGKERPPLTEAEQASVLEIIKSTPKNQKNVEANPQSITRYTNPVFMNSHPPTQLRALLIAEEFREELSKMKVERHEAQVARLAPTLLQNIELLWKECLPDLIKVHQMIKERRGSTQK